MPCDILLPELVTVSTLLYSTLKVLDEWESIFTRRLEALGEAPDDLFGPSDETEASQFHMGVSLMRHKFLLEPENSPFRGRDKASRHARKLWQFLVHQDESREAIIHYIFVNKVQGGVVWVCEGVWCGGVCCGHARETNINQLCLCNMSIT